MSADALSTLQQIRRDFLSDAQIVRATLRYARFVNWPTMPLIGTALWQATGLYFFVWHGSLIGCGIAALFTWSAVQFVSHTLEVRDGLRTSR